MGMLGIGERSLRGAGVAVAGVAATVPWLAERRRTARCRADLKELAELARTSTYLTDARVEVCAGARRLLHADTVICFEAIGRELESLEVAGPALRRPAFVDIDDPASIVSAAFRGAEPLFCSDGGAPAAPEFPDSGAVLAAPIIRGMDRMGLMVWLWRQPRGPLSAYEQALVDVLVAEKGLAIERDHQLQLGDGRLGRDWAGRSGRAALDALAVEVAATQRDVEGAIAAGGAHPEPAAHLLEQLVGDTAVKLQRIRELVEVLRAPTPVSDMGFRDALAALVADAHARSGGADVALVAEPTGPTLLDLRPSVVEAVLFVVAHALHRARADAGARRVRVTATVDASRLTATVEADGAGRPASSPVEPAFDAPVRERARLVGGDLLVGATPGGGTTLAVRVERPTSSALLDGDSDRVSARWWRRPR
jgi:hypothetical protein